MIQRYAVYNDGVDRDSIPVDTLSMHAKWCKDSDVKKLEEENKRMREAIQNVLKGDCTVKEVYERFKALENSIKEVGDEC